jgi:hypothetical protein
MKLKIKLLDTVMLGGKMLGSGTVVECGRSLANDLVARGLAKLYEEPAKK